MRGLMRRVLLRVTNLALPLWLWCSLRGAEFTCRLTCRARS